MRIASGLLLTALVSGCSSVYIEPQDGEVATLGFVNRTNGFMTARYYSDNEQCTGTQALGLIPMSREERSFKVRAAQPLTVGVRYEHETPTERVTCTNMASFMPSAGTRYRIEQYTSGKENACSMALARWNAAEKKWEKENSTVFRKRYSTFRRTDGCEPPTADERKTLKISDPSK